MKFVHKAMDRGSGHIVLVPEYPEDMWHLFNLIRVGDNVQSTTIRKVQTESATGSSTSSRVRTTLKINVENIDLDTMGGMLRLKGKNIEENPYVKVGLPETLFPSLALTAIHPLPFRWAPITHWTWN